jgi:hypothetical protein
MPTHIQLMVFQFLEPKERFKFQLLNRNIKESLESPYLWKEIIIRNQSAMFVTPTNVKYFNKILVQASQLQIISLKYCSLFNAEVLNCINQNCNPFALKELYLDGCEAVSDSIFDCITSSKEENFL